MLELHLVVAHLTSVRQEIVASEPMPSDETSPCMVCMYSGTGLVGSLRFRIPAVVVCWAGDEQQPHHKIGPVKRGQECDACARASGHVSTSYPRLKSTRRLSAMTQAWSTVQTSSPPRVSTHLSTTGSAAS